MAQQRILDTLKQSPRVQNQITVADPIAASAIISTAKIDPAFSEVNRATEQLLLKYNISDVEVGYRFRGK